MLPAENKNIINWTLFCLIFLIWGSSFILMKIALFDSHGARLFTVLQVAAIRIITAAAVLLPVVYRQWKCVPANLTGYIILSGIVGTLVPALLFCYAETKIDSTLAGTLNSLTPVFTILISGFFSTSGYLNTRWLVSSSVLLAYCFFFLAAKVQEKVKYSAVVLS